MTSAHVTPLRVGLLLDSLTARRFVHDFITWAKAQESLELTALIVVSGSKRGDFRSPLAKKLLDGVVAIENLLLRRNPLYHDDLDVFDASLLVPTVLHSGAVTKPAIDLLISFASAAPAADIAQTARLGIISVRYDGSPAGFHEVYAGSDTSAFAIECLKDGVSEALLRGSFGTQFYYLLNQAALRRKSVHYLKGLVARLVRGEKIAGAPTEVVTPAPITSRQVLMYFVRLLRRVATKVVRRAGSIEVQWQVGVLKGDWKDSKLFACATAIVNPPGRFLADPFVINRDDQTCVFVEDYDMAARRGRISVYQVNNGEPKLLGIVLDEPFHLSFPYLFEYRGELFMCPESNADRTIRIYKCDEFPLRWSLHKIIMRDVTAVDTMLFERGGKWWMLTNIGPSGMNDFPELLAFWANSPLDETWTPHRNNPLLVDAAKARNAGLLRDGERLYRVAQAQGFDFYGKATTVNEIVQLDENGYAERRVMSVQPEFRPGILGTHHIHSDGATTVMDFASLGRPR
jgi:hypothetical protein